MPNPKIAVQITGQNNLGPTLVAIQKQLSGVQRNLGHSQSQITKMTDKSKIEGLASGFGKLSGASFDFYKNISRSVDAMGVLTGGTSLAGILALSRGISALGQSQLNASRSLNMDPHKLVVWQMAAKTAGASIEDTTASIGGLETAVSDMKFKNSPANGFAQQFLGEGWQKKYKDDASLLIGISTNLQKLHGEAKRSAIQGVEENFRLGSGFTEDFLLQGPAFVQAALEKANRAAPSNKQIGNLDQLSKSFTGLENSITGAGESAVSSIAPKLIPGLDSLSKWIDGHQKIVGDFELTIAGLTAGLTALGAVKIGKNLMFGPGKSTTPAVPAVPAGPASVVKKGALDSLAELYGLYLAGSWALNQGADIPAPWANGFHPSGLVTGPRPKDDYDRFRTWLNGPATAVPYTPLGNIGLDALGPTLGAPDQKAARAKLLSGAKLDAVDMAQTQLGQNSMTIGDYLSAGGVNLKAAQDAWCAAFVNSSLSLAGIKGIGSNIATDFSKWGISGDANHPLRGDVGILMRGHNPGEIGGHVGLLTGIQKTVKGVIYDQFVSGNEGSGPHSTNQVDETWVPASEITDRTAASPGPFSAAQKRWDATHPDDAWAAVNAPSIAGDNGSDSGKLEVHFSGLPSGMKATVKHTPTNGIVKTVIAMATAGGTAATGGF
jgi:hypothetical protein